MTTDTTTTTTTTGMDACMQAATPGPEHARLGAFVGTWKAQVKHWMGPDAEPHASTGEMVNEWMLGDRWVRQRYRCDSGRFEGFGLFGFNNITRRYEGFWVDTMSTGMSNDQGTCDEAGTTWEMTTTCPNPMDGSTMLKRSTIRVLSPNKHVMEMYFAPEARPDAGFKAMEIVYERV